MTTTLAPVQTRLAELLNTYADLIEKGHADRDVTDHFDRDNLTDMLRMTAALNPEDQHTARRMVVKAGADVECSHSVMVRAIDIVTNIL